MLLILFVADDFSRVKLIGVSGKGKDTDYINASYIDVCYIRVFCVSSVSQWLCLSVFVCASVCVCVCAVLILIRTVNCPDIHYFSELNEISNDNFVW